MFAVALVLSLSGSPLAAQCVGDCGGDGEVTIDELLLMVNIALDNTPAPQCTSGDANGDRTITVNEIIAAVTNALAGCGPDVSGFWQQDQVYIESSTCASDITAIAQESVAAGDFNCTYYLVPNGEHVTITATCAGETDVFEGALDATGLLTVTSSEQETVDGCTLALAETTSGVVTTSPTVGTHLMRFSFSPGCGFASCTIVVRGRWTKLSAMKGTLGP
jgi:hypothetical protein